MLGILLALGIQAPIAKTSSCKNPNEIVGLNATSNATNGTTVEEVSKMARRESISVWEDYKYAIVALGFAVTFVVCNLLLLFFVKERTGKHSYLLRCRLEEL